MREIARAMRQYVLAGEQGADRPTIAGWDKQINELVTAYRTRHGPAALTDDHQRELMNRERERALDALAVGEVLRPMIAEELRVPRRGGAPRHTGGRREHGSAAPKRSPTGTPEVADLIDSMLVQDAASQK